MQGIDDLLGTAHREGGDDNLAAAAIGLGHHTPQGSLGLFRGFVLAVAVGALNDEIVYVMDRAGVSQDGQVFAAQVPAESQPALLAVLLDIEDGNGRAQNVPRVAKGGPDPRNHVKRPVVTDTYKVLEALVGVLLAVQRFHRGETFAAPLFVDISHILFLDVS